MATLERIEIWSDLECNSGTRLAVFNEILSATWRRDLSGEDQLTVEVPRAEAAWAQVQEERVLRHAYSGTFDEFRIRQFTEKQADIFTGELLAEGIRFDLLANSGLLERIEANGLAAMHFEVYSRPPSEHVDIILGSFAPFISGAPAYFSKGTIDPTAVVDMIYDWDSPYSAFLELAKITQTEFSVRRNGTTDYKIDLLTQIGSGGDQPLFTVGRNILKVEHKSSTEDQATRLYPKGGTVDEVAASVAENGFIVTNVSGNDLTLNEDCVTENDQWNAFYLMEQDGTVISITDSTAPNIVTATHSTVEDDIVTFVLNSAGDQLQYVDLPSAQATYGIKSKVLDRTDIPGINNFAWNGYLQNWTDGGRGDAPCLPSFAIPAPEIPEGPGGGATTCIRRDTTGLDSKSTFGPQEGEVLTAAWLHRVESTGGVNNPAVLSWINSTLGTSLSDSSFGYYIAEGGSAKNTTSPGPAIDQFSYGNEGSIESIIALGPGCQDAGLIAKWQGSDDYYVAELRWTGGTIRARIQKKLNGTETNIGTEWNSAGGSCTTAYTVKFVFQDGVQQLYVDGTLRSSGTDTAFDGTSGFAGFLTDGAVDSGTNRGASFTGATITEGANEIIMFGLTENWTIEACGLTPAAADSNGKATLAMGGEMECATLVVKDDVAATQGTFTGTVPIVPGDRYFWTCDDANPGINPDLNRTHRGHLFFDDFASINTCWKAGLLDTGGSFQVSASGKTFNAAPQDEFHRAYESCWARDEMLVQGTVRSVGNILSEPGIGKITTDAGGTAGTEIVGYLAYISDATSGTFHLAEISQSAPEAQPTRTNLDTDTTWTYAADTDYVIQLYCGSGVQEARLWDAGTLVATCSATDGSHFTAAHKGTRVHVSSSGANTSTWAEYRAADGKDIVVTQMPTGYKAKVLNVSDTVVASATESSGIATIDMLGATTPMQTNVWRSVIVTTAGDVEVARYSGVVHPGDTYEVR
jgi:hypothetical protein